MQLDDQLVKAFHAEGFEIADRNKWNEDAAARCRLDLRESKSRSGVGLEVGKRTQIGIPAAGR